jgi:hypothetical protein
VMNVDTTEARSVKSMSPLPPLCNGDRMLSLLFPTVSSTADADNLPPWRRTIALSAALVLSGTLPGSATSKHRRIAHVHSTIYSTVPDASGGSCPPSGGHLAVAVARSLALAHHQIAGDSRTWPCCAVHDSVSGTKRKSRDV